MLYTIIICTAVALAITILTSTKYLALNMVMSYSIGFVIFAIAISLILVFKPKHPLYLAFIFLVALCSGVLVGVRIGSLILNKYFSFNVFRATDDLQFIVICIIASSVATYFFYSIRRIKLSKEMVAAERIKNISIEKEALETKLRMLQAQIKPHFLFNSLSNILNLIDTAPGKAKLMLIDLTNYLRISLSRTMPEKTTLAQEAEMIEAYLNIQKIRMGERLNFKINIPENIKQYSFPPMLIQPLVENAINHGLESKVAGGEIVISAVETENTLRIEVSDTGEGFPLLSKSGVGIANIRERLALLYGDYGRLKIEENNPCGTKAIVEVPVNV